MNKLVKVLMSLAAGLDMGLDTYEQLNQPAVPQTKHQQPVGFVSHPSEGATFVQPPPSPWINTDESR
jgi:hypothetical protein